MDIFQIIPMRFKSETGAILYRITRNFGVATEIFMDNAPMKTGYNIKM